MGTKIDASGAVFDKKKHNKATAIGYSIMNAQEAKKENKEGIDPFKMGKSLPPPKLGIQETHTVSDDTYSEIMAKQKADANKSSDAFTNALALMGEGVLVEDALMYYGIELEEEKVQELRTWRKVNLTKKIHSSAVSKDASSSFKILVDMGSDTDTKAAKPMTFDERWQKFMEV